MRADVLERLTAIARGGFIAVPSGTSVTPGTARVLSRRLPGMSDDVPGQVAARESLLPQLYQVFQAFQTERDQFALDERSAIAVEDGRVPPVYAGAWAAFQTTHPWHATETQWLIAVNDGGRFLDDWARLALDLGWRPEDIFGVDGLAWFCAGEPVKSLGPDIAITASGRIFKRRHAGDRGVVRGRGGSHYF